MFVCRQIALAQPVTVLEQFEIDQGPEQLFVVLPAALMFRQQPLDLAAVAHLARQRVA
jgi:hypothetical protein